MHMVCAYGTYNVPNLVLMGSSFKVIFYSLRTGKSAIFDGSRSILSLENRSVRAHRGGHRPRPPHLHFYMSYIIPITYTKFVTLFAYYYLEVTLG